MSLDIRTCDSPQLREALFAFRHRIYSVGLKASFDGAESGLLSDSMDALAVNYAALDNGRVVASLRSTDLAALDDPLALATRYGAADIASAIGPERMVHAGRFGIDPEHRGGELLVRVLLHAAQEQVARGICAAIFDCSPYLLRTYESLGAIRTGASFNDPVLGYKLGMLLPLSHTAHFAASRSPFAALRPCEPAPQALVDWCARNAGGAVSMGRDAAIVRRLVSCEREAAPTLLRGLDAQQRAKVLFRASAFRAQPGDQVIRAGLNEDALFLLLSGSVDVVAPHDAAQVLATMRSGDFFGEMAYLTHSPRRNCVVAREGTDLLVISSDNLRTLRDKEPAIHDALMTNIARVLSERLERMSRSSYAWEAKAA
jgi:hypothetical protein